MSGHALSSKKKTGYRPVAKLPARADNDVGRVLGRTHPRADPAPRCQANRGDAALRLTPERAGGLARRAVLISLVPPLWVAPEH